MSMRQDLATDALKALLAELPYEFSAFPPDALDVSRAEFHVIKRRNVRAVHESLWELQVYFGLQDEA